MSKRQKIDEEEHNDEEEERDNNYGPLETLSVPEAISLVDRLEQSLNDKIEETQLTWLISSLWKLNQFLLGPDLDSNPDVIRSFHLQCDIKYAVTICKVMKLHPANSEVKKNGLLSVSLLCRAETKEKNIAAFISNGIVDILGASFRTSSNLNDTGVQQWALTALANIVTGSEQRKNALVDAPCDAIHAIFSSLEKHVNDPGVQHAGLLAVGTFCSGSDERKHLFVQNGAIEAIVRAIAQHRSHPGVQGQGIMAASNISAGRGVHAEMSCTLLLAANFDQLLMDAFENHSNDVTVQAGGLGVAAHLCKLSQVWRDSLLSKDFPSSVIKILNKHTDAPSIQLWGLVAIANTVAGDLSRFTQISDHFMAHVASAVTQAINNHTTNTGVVGQAFSTVGNMLALGEETRELKQNLIQLKFPKILVQGLRTHGSSVEVVKFGLYAAGQMVNEDAPSADIFNQAGIVNETSNCLKKFDNMMVTRLACSLLYYVVTLKSGTGSADSIDTIKKDQELVAILKQVEAKGDVELTAWATSILDALK